MLRQTISFHISLHPCWPFPLSRLPQRLGHIPVVAMAPPVNPWLDTSTRPPPPDMTSDGSNKLGQLRTGAEDMCVAYDRILSGVGTVAASVAQVRAGLSALAGLDPAALEHQDASINTIDVMQHATGLPAASSDRHLRQQQAALARRRTANAMSNALEAALHGALQVRVPPGQVARLFVTRCSAWQS